MATLNWTKIAEGYTATGNYGMTYKAHRHMTGKFTLYIGGEYTENSMQTTYAICKASAQAIEDGMEERTAEAARRAAEATNSNREDSKDAEANDVPQPFDASDVATLMHPEAVADQLRQEEQAFKAPQPAQKAQKAQKARCENTSHYHCHEQNGGKGGPCMVPNVGINDSGKMATAVPTGFAVARAKALAPATGQAPHLMVVAAAGTGKTTTLVQGLVAVRGGNPCILNNADGTTKTIQPSPQQTAIWNALKEGPAPCSVAFVAFNRSIAQELQRRVPTGCDAMTMHSMGAKAVRNSFNLMPGERGVNKWRVNDILAELLGMDSRQMARELPALVGAVEKLVGLCKLNLVDGADQAAVLGLAKHYDVELNGEQARVLDLVPRVLERCLNVAKDGCIDFNDMIWLPVALNLPTQQYDLLLVDEAQDLNRCQQELVRRSGKRLVFCGDPRQAIYGFAGADAESMPRMQAELDNTASGVECLPLNVTRRCGKAIVAEANSIVPDFFAHEDNGPGIVRYAKYTEVSKNPSGNYWMGGPTKQTTSRGVADTYLAEVASGDMVLCRVNAPLVSQCFKLIRMGRKATIQGRDIGAGLVKLVEKLNATDATDLAVRVNNWADKEMDKEQAQKRPSDAKLMAIQDKADCLVAFTEGKQTVQDVLNSIDRVFTDNPDEPGVRLSSIHKAKGLEAERVFFIRNEDAPCPHPMARTAWAQEQEQNLLYVAITRAIKELIWVA